MGRFNTWSEYFRKNFGKQSLNHIPGDLKMPFLGDTLKFLKNPNQLFADKRKQYGDVYKMRLFGENVVFMVGAEANRFVLIEQAKYFSSKEGWDFSIGELFHGGLMLLDDQEHKHHRSILQSAFKKEPLAGYLEEIIPAAQSYFASWQNKENLKVFPAMKELTLQIAGKVFFGLELGLDLSKINRAIMQVVRASTAALPFAIPYTTYWYGIKSRRVLEDYFKNLIATRRQQPTKDIFGMLCVAKNEEGEQLSDQEIIDHLIFLLMAGHDTTASTLTSLMYELATHPEWQSRLREKSCFFAENNTLNFQTINQLEELDWAIKEALRLHPPLIMIPRKNSQEIKFEEFTLPKDTAVSVLIYQNHQAPQHFEQPEVFDPQRFAQPRAEHKKCPHAYAPFGAGQHHCLGFAFAEMQIKAIMHQILLNFEWSVPQGYQAPYFPIPLQEPKDGLPVKLKKLVLEKEVIAVN
jgi:cytochrome P450